MLKNLLHFCAVGWFVLACQTIPDSNIGDIPEKIKLNFAPCIGDGTGELTFFSNAQFLLRIQANWAQEASGMFELELLGIFDEPLHYLKWQDDDFIQQGKLTHQFSQLNKDSQNFLIWDKYFVGLKKHELACLLELKLPKSWKDSYTSIYQDKNITNIYWQDEFRRIHFTSNNTGYCSHVEWNIFGPFWTQGIKWCVDENNKKLTMSGYKDYQIIWTKS